MTRPSPRLEPGGLTLETFDEAVLAASLRANRPASPGQGRAPSSAHAQCVASTSLQLLCVEGRIRKMPMGSKWRSKSMTNARQTARGLFGTVTGRHLTPQGRFSGSCRKHSAQDGRAAGEVASEWATVTNAWKRELPRPGQWAPCLAQASDVE